MTFRNNVEKASQALLDSQTKKKNNTLFEDDDVLELGISITEETKLPRIPRVKLLSVVSSVYPNDCEVCLLTRPPQRKYKDISQGITHIKKVIDTQKLQKKYTEIKTRAALCKSFHLFLMDRSIRGVIPKLLGGQFLRKKYPVPIRIKDNISTESLKQDIDKYLSRTPVLFRDTTRLLTVKIGRSSQSPSQIAENAEKAMEEFVKVRYFPQKWDHVKSVYIKMAHSPSLVVYSKRLQVPISLPSKKNKKVQSKEGKTPSKSAKNTKPVSQTKPKSEKQKDSKKKGKAEGKNTAEGRPKSN